MSKQFERYQWHGNVVWVDSELKDKHRERNLCFSCDLLEDCSLAKELYAFCVKNTMATPVAMCPNFKEKV